MPLITISSLGTRGRFGNQMFQYALARAYAEAHHCDLQTPSWVGQKIFKIDDPPISRQLPLYNHMSVPPNGQVDVDLFGYFQNVQCLNLMSRSWLKRVFDFREEWKEKLPKEPSYYIAAHLRRGDYLSKFSRVYCIVSKQSYYAACNKFGFDKSKIVWVSEENPKCSQAVQDPSFSFLTDFMTLVNSDVLLRSNSTFAWWAGVLGNGKVYSPLVENRVGHQTVEFVEGNWPRLLDQRNSTEINNVISDLHLREG